MESTNMTHKILMTDRNRIVITGVKRVANFNMEAILLDTINGMLLIKGSDLEIRNFSLNAGEVVIHGTLDQLKYTDEHRQDSQGLFGRLFG